MSARRIYIFDSTLRDGAQTQGIDFSAADKMAIAGDLDALGVDYVEGGWPGANPTDDAFFAVPPTLKQARLTAFGMTRRAGRSAENDPGVATLLDVGTPAVCIVGKTWDFQARVALGVEEDENRAMIADTIRHAAANTEETLFDAEHFFDGYKSDADFAMRCAEAALEAGARWIVLCDTNGGTLPEELGAITGKVVDALGGKNIGIHCHDDTGNAVANSLAAVAAGACQVQGTLNGLGERCGNANLISVIPNLVLKMGLDAGIPADGLSRLTHISRLLDERLNRAPDRSAPFVGESAFAHKGGLHVSGIEKDPRCYEHIEPETVGNHRHIVVSDQSGRANVLARFREIGIEIDSGDKRVGALVELVKQREFDGYSYDGADASFELLAHMAMEVLPKYFSLRSFRVIDERRWNAKEELITLSEATIKAQVGEAHYMTVAEGNGPVNALDSALREVLLPVYPELEDLRLVDYKVRILRPGDATAAMTRVMIESADGEGERWNTVGVSTNIIDASYAALRDSIHYKLFRDSADPSGNLS